MINRKVYRALNPRPDLMNKKISLQTANGSTLQIDGLANLRVRIGAQTNTHDFFVVKNLNRNIILGRDWLKQNRARIYFDLGALRINEEYIAFEEDKHIPLIVRLDKPVVLKPQHMHTCRGKTRISKGWGDTYQTEQLTSGYVSSLCGISIANTVITLDRSNKVPVLIMNNTNQTVRLRRGCPVARLNGTLRIEEISRTNKPSQQVTSKELSEVKVDSEFKDEVMALLMKNRDVFASKDKNLGMTDTVQMKIDTGDHEPIKKQPYRTPLRQRKLVDDAIDEMLDAGIVKRSRSPWGFPIVLVEKKDGSKRFCVDYRALNKITKNNAHPLPVIDDILACLGTARYFSKLDLKSGYWQVEVHEGDKEKTAFTCHRGLFQFNVMPFGLANAPGVFQELMSVVLEGQEGHALAYLDDILVFSDTVENHLEHIQRVLNSLRRHNLRLKPTKCEFFRKETQYLGFRISSKGIQPDYHKVKSIKAVTNPSTVREVRGFIGMCSYYRRFIPDFSDIAEPLIKLTRKYSRFQWGDACQMAFDRLKAMLADMVTLAYPDPSREYRLYTDASNHSIGACLTQCVVDELEGQEIEKPVYFLSHKLSDTQTRWSTIEREAYAIHYSLQKLHHYLHGATFTIYTDHKPLQYLLNSPMQNRKIQVWALSIAGYNCRIEYLQGKNNVCADLLSRSKGIPGGEIERTVEIDDRTYEVDAINSNHFEPRYFASYKSEAPHPIELEKPVLPGIDMIREQDADKDIIDLKNRIKKGRATKLEQKKYIIMDEVVYYLSQPDDEPMLRLYVPSHLRARVLVQYHNDNGHVGTEKTFQAIRQKYFWPCLLKEVVEHVNGCIPCQTRNLRTLRPRMQESDVPPFPFAKIAVDICGPYPQTTSGNQYIVTFIDIYSGWPECFPVPNKKAETVSHLLMEEVFPRFGAPLQIVSDNGKENINYIMRKTLEELNVHHVTTSYYHPQSNGKVERLHRTMNDILAKKIGENRQSWDLYINQMLAALRFNVSESTKFSPYYLLYGRDVILPLDNILKPRKLYYGDEHHEIALQEQHRAFTLIRNYQKRVKQRQADRLNDKIKEIEFKVGDFVYYRNNHKRGKLDKRWKPNYIIVEKTGPVSYRIKDQLTNSVVKAHAEHLRVANVDSWDIPDAGRTVRKATLAAPVDSDTSSVDSEIEENDYPNFRRRCQRENSTDESDIPIMERQMALNDTQTDVGDNDRVEIINSGTDRDTGDYEDTDNTNNDGDREYMEVCENRKRKLKGKPIGRRNENNTRKLEKKEKITKLVDALVDLI